MRKFLVAFAAAAAVSIGATPLPAHGQSQPSDADYMKQAGNFLKNCDARADAEGNRPEPNYVCLAFMAGLVEGYTYGAVANGNPRPYCLPRPASLAELADMLTTVIERGVEPTRPTAAVFHFLLETNFKCPPEAAEVPSPSGSTDDRP
ncbi:MAG: hypothetical protein AAGB11_13585 [Pseudomonadota bacterium]